MTDLRKAAEIALEALSFFGNNVTNPAEEFITSKAIDALRQALAQPEQPVSPPISPDQYERVCFTCGACTGKPWVSLTDEEIMEPWPFETRIELVRWIEAKLREKNK